jgi:hypothetical protein
MISKEAALCLSVYRWIGLQAAISSLLPEHISRIPLLCDGQWWCGRREKLAKETESPRWVRPALYSDASMGRVYGIAGRRMPSSLIGRELKYALLSEASALCVAMVPFQKKLRYSRAYSCPPCIEDQGEYALGCVSRFISSLTFLVSLKLYCFELYW